MGPLAASLLSLPIALGLAQQPPDKITSPRLPDPTVSLADIRTLYIEQMANELDDYLRAEISKKFRNVHPGLTIVLDPDLADAVLIGVTEQRKGTAAVITGRYLRLHDNTTGAVSLVDPTRKFVLWSSEAGDRSIWLGPLKRGGPRKVADRLARNLKKAITRARKEKRKHRRGPDRWVQAGIALSQLKCIHQGVDGNPPAKKGHGGRQTYRNGPREAL